MQIRNIINYKSTIAALAMSAVVSAPFIKASSKSLPDLKNDEFVTTTVKSVPPEGTDSKAFLKDAPNPQVKIAGEIKNAAIVVDVDKKYLYRYDKDGKPACVYLIATGKPSMPTHKGVRVVHHIESYPYQYAPWSTVRRKNPRAFGPRALILYNVDVATGKTSQYPEFIHGNNDKSSLGKAKSKGCMRMDNNVILELSKIIKKGDIVLIK